MLSFPQNIPTITEFVVNALTNSINSVCDVGCGMGKYGLLIKERYLSVQAEKHIIPTWNKKLIGVEDNLFFHNNSPLDRIYDEVYLQSALSSILPAADLYLFIDLVEHWTKEQFDSLSLPGHVLVSTPKECVMYTEHYYGDDRVHITQYTEEDFEGWINLSTPLSHIYVRIA